jgi:lysophospholipase L1-like esterase
MKLLPHTKLLMIGDSITDAGRSDGGEATPWSPQQGLGQGYVNLIDARIQAEKPEACIRVMNRGISGNTIRDLKGRWQEDVLDYKTEYVSIKIGINDIWRQYDIPLQTESHVLIDEYEATYVELLEQTRSELKGLILMTPYVIINDKNDPMRKTIDQYSEVVKALGKKYDATVVETQPAFDRFMEHRHSSSLSWDSIHPNTTGHMLLANAFFSSVEF